MPAISASEVNHSNFNNTFIISVIRLFLLQDYLCTLAVLSIRENIIIYQYIIIIIGQRHRIFSTCDSSAQHSHGLIGSQRVYIKQIQ